MKHGKFEKSVPHNGDRKRSALILLVAIMVLSLSVGGTAAYVLSRSDAVINRFNPVQVSCQVETGGTGINIKNTSDIPAYLRASYAINWVSSDGVSATKPNGSVAIASGWKLQNGFYYYTGSVNVGGSIPFITSYSADNKPSDDYSLTVEVIAEAIQASGTDGSKTAVMDAWNVQP